MIRFVNGRGQLGDALRHLHDEFDPKTSGMGIVRVYHTWNVWDKEESAQKNEYDKFEKYVDDHLDEKIVFVSTYSQNENYYVHYKQRAEAYLLSNHPNGFVIRLPNIIGKKGIIKKLRDNSVEPYGEIEIISLEDAARRVLECTFYTGLRKMCTVRGHPISASVIKSLFANT
jgi:hypothetical protein